MDNSFEQVISQLPDWFRNIAEEVPALERKNVTELRLFSEKAAVWMIHGQQHIFHRAPISRQQLNDVFYSVCRGSVHSFQQEICEGYITMQGGHRVGLCGTAVFHKGQQTGLRDITSMNIRFAKNVKGCADALYQQLKLLNAEKGSFLLVGPPGSGKTTVLRDYSRILAEQGIIAAVLDERGELDCCDVGHPVHVLKNLPKEKAILQAVRTLAPQVILCDEIGSSLEAKMLCDGLNCGCHFIASVHGDDLTKLLRKPILQPFLEQQSLDALVLLEPVGKVKKILRMEELYETDGMWNDFSLRYHGRYSPSAQADRGREILAGAAPFLSADS